MASLDHPNIVPVYAIGKEFNLHYFVMKFLTGWTLSERLKRVRLGLADPFGVEETRDILVQICEGLEHAHRRGLIHRDIKPSNIMTDPDGHATIMDFGIVKESEDDTLTKTGIVFGTPDYMAPEHAQGKPPSPATDLYSLGIVAYEMLTGEQPFRGGTPFSMVLKHIKEPPPPLIDRRDDLHQSFQDVIFCTIAKEPSDRYESAGHMAAALRALTFGAEVESTPHTGPDISTPSVSVQASAPPNSLAELAAPSELLSDPGADERSLPKNRPSIYPRASAPIELEGRMTSPPRHANADVEIDLATVRPRPSQSDRPGHYSHLITSRSSGQRRRLRIFKYWALTTIVVGAVGALIV